MATIFTDLQDKFRRGGLPVRLIYLNVGVFLVLGLLQVAFILFNRTLAPLFQWVELPASFGRLAVQPWSLLTYMFVHLDLLHILFNMLWLYWFGSLFLQFFSTKHMRGLYIMGGLCGGLLYMLAYNIFPYFHTAIEGSFLLGASASILAIVAATAYREPNYPIPLFLLGTLRLKYLALIVIGMDLLLIPSGNAGGHIAHLGGALAGLAFAALLNKGIDLTAWLNKTIDFLCHPLPRPRKPKMKVHYNTDRRQDYDYNARRKAQSDEIDQILDKLKKSGYQSLSTEEKKRLFDASQR